MITLAIELEGGHMTNAHRKRAVDGWRGRRPARGASLISERGKIGVSIAEATSEHVKYFCDYETGMGGEFNPYKLKLNLNSVCQVLACHEAGHGVVSYALGRGCSEIVIRPSRTLARTLGRT